MNNKYLKINILSLVLMLISTAIFAQTEPAPDLDFWPRMFGNITLIAGAVVIAAAFWAIVRMFLIALKMEELRILREKGVEEVVEQYRAPEKSFWQKLTERLEGAVPIENEKDILFDHAFDGIRELDNKLPPWWVGMFYITIIISGIYWYTYHMSDIGLSSAEKYELEMEEAEEAVKDFLAKQADLVTEENVELLTSEEDLALGQTVYQNLCVACHGTQGEGGVGPNFADEYWIHGGDIKDLFKTIKYGVPEKGMISWSSQLRPSDMQKVASYILTFQGTNPPNPKEPQGDLWKPGNNEEEPIGMK